jgi:UDP-N-acetylmuramoylalanine--D-glutamate ligase
LRIVDQLNDKKILIWGYGREGKSSESFIKKYVKSKSLEIANGTYDDIKDIECDVILKSPGISCFEEDERIQSQTSLFVSEFKKQIIGITGTKGKSTTASMLYSVLCACGKDALLVGNIGFPCFDYYDSIATDTNIVYEMSAHQLQRQKESPHIGVFLNLFEDHLDYYGTMERYFKAKENIVRYQDTEDYSILGSKFPREFSEIDAKGQKKVFVEEEINLNIPMKLQGEHNKFNASIVQYIASELIGCDLEQVNAAISSFEGLKHRLENIGKVDGVTYYNDSISTICESAIHAVNSTPNVSVVLVGGEERGISYEPLEQFIMDKKDIQFILMYQTGKRIYEELKVKDNCIYIERLEDAVAKAKELCKSGEACIMSPAAASHDAFNNFEDRGDRFTGLVRGI